MSFEDLLKNQSETPAPPPPPRPESKEVRFESPKEPRKPQSKLNDSYWNDEDDDAPAVVVPGRMKPPMIRRGDDSRSVASRRNDDNRSVTSNVDFKRKEEA